MNLTLSNDHQILVEHVRDFARDELLPRDSRCDKDGTYCSECLGQLYEMGLMGLRVPEEHGGLGCPMLAYGHIIRELAYASPSVSVMVGVHNMVCEAIRLFGHDDARGRILAQLATPGNLAAFAISEADAGSDPAGAKTRAEAVPGGWKLWGTKFWVSNGLAGRWFAVLARTGKAGTHKDLSMLLLDAEQAGVERRLIPGKMGLRASDTVEMILEGAFVPESHLLGRTGDGMKVALSALDGGRNGIGSQSVGIGQACLDLMVGYAKERRQFNRPIADFQAIQWMIADSQAELDASQLLVDRAAVRKDEGLSFTREASVAKLFASESANRIAYRAVQIHGGSGFVGECRVEQLYRDVRATTIYEGTSEIQRLVIAREVLRK